MKLRRLKSDAHAEAMVVARRGRSHSESTKRKIAEAKAGSQPSEATREGHAAWVAAGCPVKSPEVKRLEKLRAQWARRKKQWRLDLFHAAEMGNMELLRDVQRSKGWARERRVHDYSGKVSSGYSATKDRVIWVRPPTARLCDDGASPSTSD